MLQLKLLVKKSNLGSGIIPFANQRKLELKCILYGGISILYGGISK